MLPQAPCETSAEEKRRFARRLLLRHGALKGGRGRFWCFLSTREGCLNPWIT